MFKKKNLDFILQRDNGNRLIFRFYPRKSNCHSFNDVPPKTWNEVYKVYYSYAILESYSDGSSHVLFNCGCDECSAIDEVAARIALIVRGDRIFKGTDGHGEEYTIELLNNEIVPFGYGVSWKITEDKYKTYKYQIELWDYNNKGFRFYIDKNTLKNFGIFLQQCCEYMLKHGDPI